MKKLTTEEFERVKGRLESAATLLDAAGTILVGTDQEDKVTQIRCLIEDLREDLEEDGDILDIIIKALGSKIPYATKEISSTFKSLKRGMVVILDDPNDLERAINLLNKVQVKTRVDDSGHIRCVY
jgi:hypothetical protein